MVLFDEQDRPALNTSATSGRPTGRPRCSLGHGPIPRRWWAVTTNATADQLTLIPTAPAPRGCCRRNLVYQWGQFHPDGKRSSSGATSPASVPNLRAGTMPRPITPEGSACRSAAEGHQPGRRNDPAPGSDDAYLSPRWKRPALLPGANPKRSRGAGRRTDVRLRGSSVPGLSKFATPPPADLEGDCRRTRWRFTIGPIYISPDGKSYAPSYRWQLTTCSPRDGARERTVRRGGR
jgi:hypothetical protein